MWQAFASGFVGIWAICLLTGAVLLFVGGFLDRAPLLRWGWLCLGAWAALDLAGIVAVFFFVMSSE